MTKKSLYTAAEVKAYKEKLIKEQNGIDPILKEPFKETVATDHCHSTQHIRAALNRNTNAFEGLVTNAWNRCLKWLTDVPLPTILRNLADYYEQDYTHHPYHPGWIKSVKAKFNKLKSAQQDEVLVALGSQKGNNLKDRKEKFAKIVLDRSLGYDKILACIQVHLDSDNPK